MIVKPFSSVKLEMPITPGVCRSSNIISGDGLWMTMSKYVFGGFEKYLYPVSELPGADLRYSTGFPIQRALPPGLHSPFGLTSPPRAEVLVPKTQILGTIMTDYFDRLVFTILTAWLSQSLQRLCCVK